MGNYEEKDIKDQRAHYASQRWEVIFGRYSITARFQLWLKNTEFGNAGLVMSEIWSWVRVRVSLQEGRGLLQRPTPDRTIAGKLVERASSVPNVPLDFKQEKPNTHNSSLSPERECGGREQLRDVGISVTASFSSQMAITVLHESTMGTIMKETHAIHSFNFCTCFIHHSGL